MLRAEARSLREEGLYERAALRVEFRLANGGLLSKNWRLNDPQPEWLSDGPPGFLRNPERRWENPQDPITLHGDVIEGRELEAVMAL